MCNALFIIHYCVARYARALSLRDPPCFLSLLAAAFAPLPGGDGGGDDDDDDDDDEYDDDDDVDDDDDDDDDGDDEPPAPKKTVS